MSREPVRSQHPQPTRLRVLAAACLGYAIGTFPSADIASKIAAGNHEIRDEGSGNPGALNAMRVLGKWGYAVMVADIAKGAGAAVAGRRIAGPAGANLGGAGAVVGHCYPVWNGFRGGKGVAASIGQVIVTFPVYTPLGAAVAGATLASAKWKDRSFAATTVASAVWVGAATVWWRKKLPNGWGPEPTAALPVGAAISGAVIAARFLASHGDASSQMASTPETQTGTADR